MRDLPPVTDSFYNMNFGGAGGNRTADAIEEEQVVDSTTRQKAQIP